MVSSAVMKVEMSASSWPPSTLLMIRLKIMKPAPTSRTPARPPARAGAVSSRIMVPSRKRESRFGASRKSSAERDGGVSTTIRSHRSVARSWPSFSIAMYSCVPAKEDDSAW
jgi:hypothetical protein